MPGEGVLEAGFEAFAELFDADDVADEEVLVFAGEAHVVEAGVVGADGDGDAGVAAAGEDLAEVCVVLERAGAEVGSGADFEALFGAGDLGEELGEAEGDLDAVADAVEEGEELGAAAVGGFVEVRGGFELAGAGVLEELDELAHAVGVGLVGSGEVDGADGVGHLGGEVDDGLVDVEGQAAVHAEDLLEDERVALLGRGGGGDDLDDGAHLVDAVAFAAAAVGAVVGGVAELHVGEVVEEEGAADEAGDEVEQVRVGGLLDPLDEGVELEVVGEVGAFAGEEAFEAVEAGVLVEEGVAVALEVGVEDVGEDGAAEVEVEFGVEAGVFVHGSVVGGEW